MTTIEEAEFRTLVLRETDCENRLNMLDTAQKVNSKFVNWEMPCIMKKIKK